MPTRSEPSKFRDNRLTFTSGLHCPPSDGAPKAPGIPIAFEPHNFSNGEPSKSSTQYQLTPVANAKLRVVSIEANIVRKGNPGTSTQQLPSVQQPSPPQPMNINPCAQETRGLSGEDTSWTRLRHDDAHMRVMPDALKVIIPRPTQRHGKSTIQNSPTQRHPRRARYHRCGSRKRTILFKRAYANRSASKITAKTPRRRKCLHQAASAQVDPSQPQDLPPTHDSDDKATSG